MKWRESQAFFHRAEPTACFSVSILDKPSGVFLDSACRAQQAYRSLSAVQRDALLGRVPKVCPMRLCQAIARSGDPASPAR